MVEFVAYFIGLVADHLGHAGHRWAWWIVGAVVILIAVLSVVTSGDAPGA